MKRLSRILVALDFSPSSTQALETAIFLAKPFGAELHLVHAFGLTAALVGPAEIAIPDPYWNQMREAAARKLEKAREHVSRSGVAVQCHLSEVPAAAAIVRRAREVDADLIVMGTRGHSRLKHVLLGSVAARTLRLAPCPVLAVKTETELEASRRGDS